MVRDSGPQLDSAEFNKFTKSWGIELTTTSLHHRNANGKVESEVKVAKRMIRKTTKSGEDKYLAMLNIRNVPTQGVDSSPAQGLMGRRTRTLLPTTQSLLESRNPANRHESEELRLNQIRQAKYYNRSAHDLSEPKAGDTVRMKPFVICQKSWEKAEVTRRLHERSHEVQIPGTTLRRNRQHLVKTSEPHSQQDTLEQGKAEAQVGSDQPLTHRLTNSGYYSTHEFHCSKDIQSTLCDRAFSGVHFNRRIEEVLQLTLMFFTKC